MPTPRKSPATASAKKRRSSTGASPLASTSKATLDSPARSLGGSAKKGKGAARAKEVVVAEPEEDEDEEDVEEEEEGEAEAEAEGDDRFAAFLADAGDDEEGAADEAADGGEGEDAVDDRFASFPTGGEGDADDVELSERDLLARTTLPAHLLPRAMSSKKAKTPGLVYLSRIPPGMGPGKVKHLLSRYGEVGRLYLARADAGKEISAAKRAKQRERHQSHNFKEGWVEFLDKRVARSVAEMLNAQTIGGKKSERWHDDIWTMKYLPRFRWDQLSEQVALERATQTSLLRFHLTHSKAEQESYLSAVERARTNSKIEEKAVARGKVPKGAKGAAGAQGAAGGAGGKRKAEDQGEGADGGKRKREYRQREAVDVSKKLDRRGGGEQQLESVLGRLF
ncbi:hypothetical protein JCM6882_003290 [Rhodosporidiobolus microsporus]